MNRRMWTFSAGEVRVLVLALSVAIWGVAVFNVATPGMHLRMGPLKGADFVHFYVFGSLVNDGRADLLYDAPAQQAIQTRLVPASSGHWYMPVYGPQTALLFAGFARLPYLWAALVWACLSLLFYLSCVWALWRASPALLAYKEHTLLAALGFLPLYTLVMGGQTSVIPLICLTAGYLALRGDRTWWAGVAFGFLAIKPQFGVAIAVVMLARREWRVIGGAIAAIAAQVGLSMLVLGTGPMLAYVRMLRRSPGLAALLEPDLSLLHSLRAFWTLLVPSQTAALALYALTAGGVLVLAARLWRPSVRLSVRYAALVLATVLVSPHLGVYDLVMLVPAFILAAGDTEISDALPPGMATALLCLAYFVPLTEALTPTIHVQLSVPVFALWLLVLSRAGRPRGGTSAG